MDIELFFKETCQKIRETGYETGKSSTNCHCPRSQYRLSADRRYYLIKISCCYLKSQINLLKTAKNK